jgi:hypothetical protein
MGAIGDRVDLLVINRFGKAESLGRGLLAVFTAAIEAGVPVLTAARHPYEQGWERFHGGMGHILHASPDAIADFFMGPCRDRLAPAAA